ncbi:prevent-host-death family protein [[Eubacterium] yurii subsp. margaretiae ATCC 43715]|nr:prevent-host-death family protein [[Eubacterium] yurii subsp. margaretiae ATCC 43715]
MNINTNTLVSISEANQNFSKVARLVDKYGSAVILKNNSPKYIILEFPNEELLSLSNKYLGKNKKVYEELAK